MIDFATLLFGNYSTSEVDTGFKWIDGKSIFKKTISWAVTGSGTEQGKTDPVFATIQNIVAIGGILQNSQEHFPTQYMNPAAPTGQNFQLKVGTVASVKQFRFNTGSSGTASATICYTKV